MSEVNPKLAPDYMEDDPSARLAEVEEYFGNLG